MNAQNTSLESAMRQCLQYFLPTETDIAGPGSVDDIIELVISQKPLELDDGTKLGRPNDVIEIIKLIFEFAGFVKTTADLYLMYRKALDKTKSTEKCHAELDGCGSTVNLQDRSKVVDKVIEIIEP
jgi:hypothetical protein